MKNNKIKLSFIILIILIITLINCSDENSQSNKEFLDYSKLKDIQVHTSQSSFENTRFIFLINFTDFNCTICLKQFQHLSDLIAEDEVGLEQKVQCIVESGERDLIVFRKMVNRWKRANRLTYDVSVIKDFREKLSLKKSCILLNKSGKFEVFYLPLKKEEYKFLRDKLRLYGNIEL